MESTRFHRFLVSFVPKYSTNSFPEGETDVTWVDTTLLPIASESLRVGVCSDWCSKDVRVEITGSSHGYNHFGRETQYGVVLDIVDGGFCLVKLEGSNKTRIFR